jgi:hypothetical protein
LHCRSLEHNTLSKDCPKYKTELNNARREIKISYAQALKNKGENGSTYKRTLNPNTNIDYSTPTNPISPNPYHTDLTPGSLDLPHTIHMPKPQYPARPPNRRIRAFNESVSNVQATFRDLRESDLDNYSLLYGMSILLNFLTNVITQKMKQYPSHITGRTTNV